MTDSPRTHRFTPRQRAALTENLAAGLAGALLTGAYLLLARDATRREALLFGAAAGVLIVVLYSLRARLMGLNAVEITPDEIVVERRADRRSLRWDDVEKAHHTYLGGDRWSLRSRSGAPPLGFHLDGYTPDEASRINALIRERVEEARRAREDAPR